MAKKNTTPKTVESIRHKDKRANIPTEELRDFVAEDEHVPKTMLYQRDPCLDPQLVWKGKDEQDRQDLAVCRFTSRRRFTRGPSSTAYRVPNSPATISSTSLPTSTA